MVDLAPESKEKRRLGQPGLFGEAEFVERAKRWKFTGARLLDNADLCERLMTALCLGMSVNAAAKSFRVSHHSIVAVREVLAANGQLAELKERLSRKMGVAIELGVEGIIDDLVSGKMPANVKPIAVGVLSDKKALLDGGVTGRVEVRSAVEVNYEEFERVWRERVAGKGGAGGLVIDAQEVKALEAGSSGVSADVVGVEGSVVSGGGVVAGLVAATGADCAGSAGPDGKKEGGL